MGILNNAICDENSTVFKNSTVFSKYKIVKKFIDSGEYGTPKQILEGLRKLTFIFIELKDGVNPQEFFETINGTGRKITDVDRIRNFLLCNEMQGSFYKDYWLPIEENTGKSSEDFFLRYISMLYSSDIKATKLYDKFVEKMNGQYDETINNSSKKEILKRLKEYSKIYSYFIRGYYPNDKEISYYLRCLLNTDVTTYRSFLLKVFYEMGTTQSSINEVKKILKLLLKYILSIGIVAGTDGANKQFPRLCKNESKSNCEVLIEFLLGLKNTTLVDKGILKSHLLHDDIYSKKTIKKLLLIVINNSSRDGDIYNFSNSDDIWKYEVDHIIPQNPDNWSEILKESLGENWKSKFEQDYQHKLGNLTLMSKEDNSAISNKGSKDTLQYFTKHPYNVADILQEGWVGKNSFTPSDIYNRTEKLTERLMKILDMHLPEVVNNDSGEVKTLDSVLTYTQIRSAFIDSHKLDLEEFTYPSWFKSIVAYVFSNEKYKHKAYEILNKKKLKFITTNKQDFKQGNVHCKNFVFDGTEIFIFTHGNNERIKGFVRQFLSAIAPELIPTVKIYCDN